MEFMVRHVRRRVSEKKPNGLDKWSDTYKEWKLTVQGEWRNGNIHGYTTKSYSDGPSWTRTTRTGNASDTFGIRLVSMKRDSGFEQEHQI